MSSTATPAFPFLFAGEYTDAESGLVYLRARYYDPGGATFISSDPLEPITGTPYGYVGNNPLNGVDPTGLYWGEGFMKTVVEVAWEIIRHPGDAAKDAGKGAANFGIGFTTAAFGTSFEDWCGEGQSWSRNIGSATFFIEATLSTGFGGASSEAGGITGHTRHGLNQAISRDGHGVAPGAILNAVRSPTNVVVDAARGTTQYVGDRAVVVLNDSGRVVTTWVVNALGWRF